MRVVNMVVLVVATLEACAGSKPDAPKAGAAHVVLDSTFVQLESMKTSAPKFYEFLRASYFLGTEMGLNEMGCAVGHLGRTSIRQRKQPRSSMSWLVACPSRQTRLRARHSVT